MISFGSALSVLPLQFAFTAACHFLGSTQNCKRRLYLFQITFSGGQVSESGQAGECEPRGCQWGSSQHQYCNQLQHSPDRICKPATETRNKIRTIKETFYHHLFSFCSQQIQYKPLRDVISGSIARGALVKLTHNYKTHMKASGSHAVSIDKVLPPLLLLTNLN